MSNSPRKTIVELHKAGIKTADIVRTTGYKKSTVYDAVKRFQELGNSQDRPRSGRPTTATTPENVNKVRCRIRRNSEQSMRKMASELGISESSVRNIVKRKLRLRSYKVGKAHFLDDRMKQQRLGKSRVMKRRVAAGRLNQVLFTDEKIFTVQRIHNSQNQRELLRKKSLAQKIIQRSLFPRSVMVWAGICATGKTPLVFIDRNVKINAHVYQNDILRTVLHPWAQQHFGENNFMLQQDWAPAHGAKTTLTLCETLFPGFWGKDVWPSNSPDLNPMDFSVWSMLEQRLPRTRFATTEQLKNALERAWASITVEECATIVGNFRKRLDACISAKGSHFEHLLWFSISYDPFLLFFVKIFENLYLNLNKAFLWSIPGTFCAPCICI